MFLTRRLAGGLLAVVALVAALASPAGATTYDQAGIFFDGYSGSDRQCAWWGNRISDTDSAGDILGEGQTAATHATGCATLFPLPYGWLKSNTAVQAIYGSDWGTVSESGVYNNSGGSHYVWTYALTNQVSGQYYRVVTAHQALLAGSWRSYIKVSPTIHT